jgi:phospholipid/cholesterol/gamma-HCH transport system substrate-binding protein
MSNSAAGELRREVTVGAFAFAVIAGLFVFSIFITGGTFWSKGREVDVIFTDVMGLRKGDNVVMRGMTIGEVKNLDLNKGGGRVKVVCLLTKSVELKSDCTAAVVPTSILGGRHLALFEGKGTEPLADGTTIEGQAPHDIMQEMGDVVREFRDTLKKGALEDLAETFKQAREISEKINKGEGTLGMLVNDKTLYKDLASASADLKTITTQVREGKGSIAKLLNDDTVYNDLKTSMANMKDISQRLADGKGSLGKFLSTDETIYNDAKGVLKDFRGAIDDYRESSPILTFTTIMFGAF